MQRGRTDEDVDKVREGNGENIDVDAYTHRQRRKQRKHELGYIQRKKTKREKALKAWLYTQKQTKKMKTEETLT